MSTDERWKLYDMGRDYHRRGSAYKRWFTARRVGPPFPEDQRYTYDAAKRIVDWRNEWEDYLGARCLA